MNEQVKAFRVAVKVVCRHCRGDGFTRGQWHRIDGGGVYQDELHCAPCDGAGFNREVIELDEQTIEALRAALLSLGSMA